MWNQRDAFLFLRHYLAFLKEIRLLLVRKGRDKQDNRPGCYLCSRNLSISTIKFQGLKYTTISRLLIALPVQQRVWHDWMTSSLWTHSSVPVVPAERRAAADQESEAGCQSGCGAAGCSATEPTNLCLCAPAESLLAETHGGARRSAPGATHWPWTAEKFVKRSHITF